MDISVKNLENMVHRIAGECETPLEMEIILNGELKAYARLERSLHFEGVGYHYIEMFSEAVIPEGKDFVVVGKYRGEAGNEHFIGVTGNLVDGEYEAKYFGDGRISI